MEKSSVDLRNKLIHILWGKFTPNQFLISFVLGHKSQCLTCASYYLQGFHGSTGIYQACSAGWFAFVLVQFIDPFHGIFPCLHKQPYCTTAGTACVMTYITMITLMKKYLISNVLALEEISFVIQLDYVKRMAFFFHQKHSEIFQHQNLEMISSSEGQGANMFNNFIINCCIKQQMYLLQKMQSPVIHSLLAV